MPVAPQLVAPPHRTKDSRDSVRCFTRNGHDWADRFPAIVDAAHRIKAQSLLIDGEAVITAMTGPDFHALRSRSRGSETVLYAFDLIEHDGDDLRNLPLIERKRRLAELIGKAKRAVTRDGQTAFPKNWSLRNMPGALSVGERAKLRHSRTRPPLLMKDRRRTRCQASSSSSETQRMLVSYPPNLESVAAPATAFATSSWPRSGCEMVSRPTALVRRSNGNEGCGPPSRRS
jgi:hypothetical protein